MDNSSDDNVHLCGSSKISKEYGKSHFFIIFEEETSLIKENLQRIYPVEDRFFCTLCEKLLKEPCQSECGCRLCRHCLDECLKSESKLCPSNNCSEYVMTEGLYDKAIARDMRNVTYKCINVACEELVPLSEFNEHRESCPLSVVKCKNCLTDVQISEKDKHCCQNFSMPDPNANNNSDLSSRYSTVRPEYHGNVYGEDANKIKKYFEEDMFNLIKEIMVLIDDRMGLLEKLSTSEEERRKSYELLDSVSSSVKDIGKTIASRYISNDLTLGFYPDFIWRISEYSVKRQGTRNQPGILSPSFYTDHIGYKIRLKAFLNGNGNGKNTHLSLYMVILRGKYDALLKWPFPKKFAIELIGQKGIKGKSMVFTADDKSASFSRPRLSHNAPTGCPTFIENDKLDPYLVDDTIFVKATFHN